MLKCLTQLEEKKMIIINGYPLATDSASGIHRNTIELLKELDKIVDKNYIQLLVPHDIDKSFHFQNIEVVKLHAHKRSKLLRGRTYIWNHFTVGRYAKKNKAISLDTLLSFAPPKLDIVMVYDCIPEQFPEQYVGLKTKIWIHLFLKSQAKALKKAKLVLTDSYHAKADIEKYYPQSKGKIKVVPCGWQHMNSIKEDDTILERLNISRGNYFFTLGSRLLHKNVRWIVAAAKQNPNETFVVTGAFKKQYDGGEELDNVIYTGYLKDEEIKSLCRHCKAFIHPSKYEGFGIPPMEAMSVGARCIVSTGGSLPEVYGNSVWYIDPYKYDNIDFKEIMSKKIDDNQIILDKYSWEKSASLLKQYLDEYIKLNNA